MPILLTLWATTNSRSGHAAGEDSPLTGGTRVRAGTRRTLPDDPLFHVGWVGLACGS